jgi:predicted DNA binding CopG/RHH family protein
MNHQTQSQSTHVTVQGIDKPRVMFNHNQMASVDTNPQAIKVNSKQSHISNAVPRPRHIVEREELIYRQDVSGGLYDESQDYISENPSTSFKPRRSLRSRKSYLNETSDDGGETEPVPLRRKSTGESINKSQRQSRHAGERSWERANGVRLSRKSPEKQVCFQNEQYKVQSFSPVSSTNHSLIDNNSPETSKEPSKTVIIQASAPINYPPPAKFNKSMNVADWIRDMDLYIDICNVKDKKKTIFWAYLEEAIRKMLKNFTFDENDDIAVQELKQKLTELFGRIPLSAHEQMKAFNSCEQDVNENVRVYENRLEGLCRKAFPNCLNYEAYIIDQFTNGVLNKKLQHDLLTSKPLSIADMLDKATNYEVAYKKQSKQREESNKQSNKPIIAAV